MTLSIQLTRGEKSVAANCDATMRSKMSVEPHKLDRRGRNCNYKNSHDERSENKAPTSARRSATGRPHGGSRRVQLGE